MDDMIKNLIIEEYNKHNVKDSLVAHMVKKHKRGTYQALNESEEISEKIKETIIIYISKWIMDQIMVGEFNKQISKEILESVYLELARIGYSDILKK